jgi:hypothetical protein
MNPFNSPPKLSTRLLHDPYLEHPISSIFISDQSNSESRTLLSSEDQWYESHAKGWRVLNLKGTQRLERVIEKRA